MDIKRWDYQLEITENKNICLNFYKFSIVSKEIASAACAGQFCMIGLEKVFLRRPLSIYSVDKKNGTVSFLYKIVGKGTDILANLPVGSKVKVLGPLGQGYPLDVKNNVEPVLVAGGTGVASIHFLASSLSKPGRLYYGVRKKEELMCLTEFEKKGWNLNISTEDGSFGYKGFVTDLLAKQIQHNSVIYVCGPTPMMKKVSEIAKEKNIPGYASLEQKMACGVGNCQGCAVKIKNAYKMACKDGPVFSISDILFE
ncbi:MAG: dihydroorotate dehydrogenase electron transfer subunit [Elusimicrobia bacterium]|nr:dihydroorotate dehydrogenase electron transfer subunit [Elusimicrobiota bacterium]